LGQYGKNQSNMDIFRIGPIPVSPITTRSESARHIDNCKEKSDGKLYRVTAPNPNMSKSILYKVSSGNLFITFRKSLLLHLTTMLLIMLRLLYIHDTWVNWQRNPHSPVLDLVPTTVFIVIKSQLLNVSKLKKEYFANL
jgi:hypothetical protein